MAEIHCIDMGLDADRGNFGLMFAVSGRAGMAVDVDALVVRSFGEQSADVTVYVTEVEVVGTEHATLGWRGDGCPLTSGHAWREVCKGRIAAKATRLPLRQPVALPTSEEAEGRAVAFYIHTADESGVAFSSFAREESTRNEHLRVLVGCRTESAAAFSANRLYKATFAGQIEYKVTGGGLSTAAAGAGGGGKTKEGKSADTSAALLASLADFL